MNKKPYFEWEYEKALELDNSTLKNYIWQLNNNMSVPYGVTSDLAFRDVLWERGELPYGYHEDRLPKDVYDYFVPVDFRDKYLYPVTQKYPDGEESSSIMQLFVKEHGWLSNEEYYKLQAELGISGIEQAEFYRNNVTHISAHYIDADGRPHIGDMPINVYRLMCDKTYDPANEAEYRKYIDAYEKLVEKAVHTDIKYGDYDIEYIDYMNAYGISESNKNPVGYADTIDEALKNTRQFPKENLVPMPGIENLEELKDKTDVSQIVDEFFTSDSKVVESSDGKWRIALGGYDLVAEIYKDNTPVCGVINNAEGYEIKPYNEEGKNIVETVSNVLSEQGINVVNRHGSDVDEAVSQFLEYCDNDNPLDLTGQEKNRN